MSSREETSADVVFVYTGDGCSVPRDIISVQFNDGLQKIGEGAFCNCTSLKSITIPSTVTEISNYAFRSCSNLMEVIFNDRLQKIGYNAFINCKSLESIKLPSTVVEIGNHAFHGCGNLRRLYLTMDCERSER